MSSTYQTQLEVNEEVDNFNVELQAGSLLLSVSFIWDMILQSKWDEVNRGITIARDSDPLVGPNYKNKDYDLLDYYCNQMPYPVTMTWSGAQTILPVTVSKMSTSQRFFTLRERQETYKAIKEMLDLWEESLVWNVKITDDSNNVATGYIRPGGTIKAEEWGWNIKFLADVKSVAKNKLGLVVIQVEVL